VHLMCCVLNLFWSRTEVRTMFNLDETAHAQ
jgi:hypothetical protein